MSAHATPLARRAALCLALTALLAAGCDTNTVPPIECPAGQVSDGERCVDENECETKHPVCGPGGACRNTSGSYECVCSGTSTLLDGVCVIVSVTCANDSSLCGDHATCASGVCACDPGFTGNGATCTDVDECAAAPSSPCAPGATCTNLEGTFACTCPAGSTGDGGTCADVDECAAQTATCSADATCANVDGGFTCACNAGFEGDGGTCTFIPVTCGPSQTMCGVHAACDADAGQCVCGPGYSGDGLTCANHESCTASSCFAGVTCTDLAPPADGFTCGACPTGYDGDGGTCLDHDACLTAQCGAGTCLDSAPPSLGFTCDCPFAMAWNGSQCTRTNQEPFFGVSRFIAAPSMGSVGVADVNGDLHLDVVTTLVDPFTPRLGYLPGDGNGSFGPFVLTNPWFVNTNATIFAPIDSNASTDVVTSYGSYFEVYKANGDGGLVSGGTFAGDNPQYGLDLLPAYVNADAYLDLISVGRVLQTQTSVSCRFGDGLGGFGAPVTSQLMNTFVVSATTGDINHDGLADLVFSSSSTLTSGAPAFEVYRGDGAGHFTRVGGATGGNPVGGVTACDLTGDGRDEVIVSDSNAFSPKFTVVSVTDAGVFTAQATTPVSTRPSGPMRCADVDGDGDLDVIAAAFASPATLMKVLTNTAGRLSEGGAYTAWREPGTNQPVRLMTADFNEDTHVDTLVKLQGGQAVLQFGDGTGKFSSREAQLATPNDGAADVAVADFDKDGQLDVAVGLFYSAAVKVHRGLGHRRFAAPTTVSLPGSVTNQDGAYFIASADVNNDTKPDLLAFVLATKVVEVLLGDGLGGFTRVTAVTIGDWPTDLVARDFDSDGNIDLALMFNGVITIYRGNGSGGFGTATPIGVLGYQGGNTIVSADLDLDGHQDLAVPGAFNDGGLRQGVRMSFGNDAGTFTSSLNIDLASGTSTGYLAAGDFNEDTHPDLLAYTAANFVPRLQLLAGNGARGFVVTQVPLPSPLPTYSLSAADLNGDGHLDVVIGGYILYGTGSGTFTRGPYLTLGSRRTLIIDVDGDGRKDVVSPLDAAGVAIGFN